MSTRVLSCGWWQREYGCVLGGLPQFIASSIWGDWRDQGETSDLFPGPFSDPRSRSCRIHGTAPRANKSMAALGSNQKIMVTGATSIIGGFLLPNLLDAGYEVHAISRQSAATLPSNDKLTWHQAEVSEPEQLPDVNAQILIHLAPLWL